VTDEREATGTEATSYVPVADPAPHLSATGHRILEAARRLLRRDGFDALTFEAIAAESGENRASIRYHFGSKAGLISTLVDAVMYDGSVALVKAMAEAPTADGRRRALIEIHRALVHAIDEYLEFYDIIPHILRDEELRRRFRGLYEWYRDLDSWALAGTDDPAARARYQPLATLTVAMLDGLALQLQADPDYDVDAAVDLWQEMVDHQVRLLTALRP